MIFGSATPVTSTLGDLWSSSFAARLLPFLKLRRRRHQLSCRRYVVCTLCSTLTCLFFRKFFAASSLPTGVARKVYAVNTSERSLCCVPQPSPLKTEPWSLAPPTHTESLIFPSRWPVFLPLPRDCNTQQQQQQRHSQRFQTIPLDLDEEAFAVLRGILPSDATASLHHGNAAEEATPSPSPFPRSTWGALDLDHMLKVSHRPDGPRGFSDLCLVCYALVGWVIVDWCDAIARAKRTESGPGLLVFQFQLRRSQHVSLPTS